MTSRIVKTASRIIFPFILLFGVYIIIFGHLSPGGGFQGGVMLGVAALLIIITLGKDKIKTFSSYGNLIETLALGLLIFIGCLGFALGKPFLSNVLPKGMLGTLPSGGTILLLNIAIGLKVFAGVVLLYLFLFKLGLEK
jgi:multicomponent Na+:H+ antiporter subunit B